MARRTIQWAVQSAGPQNNPLGGPMAGQGEQQVPSKMESYMQTANQFLNTAQQFAPVVQQFAPMVQNLPAMWRLYKGFQSLPVAGAASLPVSEWSSSRTVSCKCCIRPVSPPHLPAAHPIILNPPSNSVIMDGRSY